MGYTTLLHRVTDLEAEIAKLKAASRSEKYKLRDKVSALEEENMKLRTLIAQWTGEHNPY